MEKKLDLQAIRNDYQKGELSKQSVDKNPVHQFREWLEEALHSAVTEPTAMMLATAGKDMRPSARIVLLKGVEEDGFIFFTSYGSRKGKQIGENPNVSLTFFWKELERQIRIEGIAEKISSEDSDEYFMSRPYESRLSAAASPQSKPVESRQLLEQLKDDIRLKYPDQNIPRPENWGGYKVKPNLVEFWQGRYSRLHDRIVYELTPDGEWKLIRLAP
jgi:pyridoxamine 5'-phosphate oxidase